MKNFLSFTAVAIIISSFLGAGCNESKSNGQDKIADSIAIKKSLNSPVLSTADALKAFKTEEGFEVLEVASEPLVAAPVAFSFDERGRLWVAEMIGYMPDTVGTGEEKPNGNIVILTDKNGDGKMDERTIFLDSLLLPRALCFYGNGILIATTPNLYFYELNGDKPGKRTLVDSNYTIGGNVEHEPNGLLRAMDNWVYNAKFNFRYKLKGGKWVKEQTHFRGQWGITQDDEGRLFYNNNSVNILGEYFSPGFGAANPAQKAVAGFNEKIVDNNRVYPISPTPGVNRGYMEGILNDSLKLVNFTAACSPVIYRGDLFSANYKGNAFVAEPSANLIKRNIINEGALIVNGTQAYDGKEFLASTDERFRPVFLSNGPDGALYIADMYRGIIQHKVYLTDYLKNEIKERKLTNPLNHGRIYKVVPKGKIKQPVIFSHNQDSLVNLLHHPSGWVRDKAQQMIIDGNFTSVASKLKEEIKSSTDDLFIIHALWTLEGLNALIADEVLELLDAQNVRIKIQAFSLVPSVISKRNYKKFIKTFETYVESADTVAAPYIGFLTTSISKFDKAAGDKMLMLLAENYPQNIFVADAVISNLKGRENSFYKKLINMNGDTTLTINKRLDKVIKDIQSAGENKNKEALLKRFPKGAAIFNSVCQACHGADGNGVNMLAPPLNNSEWVNGSKGRLISIVLYGLGGPVTVNNKIYKSPEISGEMPGIGHNKDFTDEDIAQLLSYVRNSWNNKADTIAPADIKAVRLQQKGRNGAFTEEELKKIN